MAEFIKVDALGDACPLPVVKAKKAISELQGAGQVEVLVDNEIAVQNLTKMAQQKGYQYSAEKLEERKYRVLFTLGEAVSAPAEDAPVCTPDARTDDAQQHGKGGQAAQHPAAAQRGAGHLALFAHFPPGRALLRGALAACRVLPVRAVLRVLVFPAALPAAGIVCRAALFATGLRVFWSAARRAVTGGILGGIAPLPLRRAAGPAG